LQHHNCPTTKWPCLHGFQSNSNNAAANTIVHFASMSHSGVVLYACLQYVQACLVNMLEYHSSVNCFMPVINTAWPSTG